MESFTGEPPAVALAFAEASRKASLVQWAVENPFASIYSAIILTAAITGLVAWDIQTFFSMFLLLSLCGAPIVVGTWFYQHRDGISR
jgi:hypothetical protein